MLCFSLLARGQTPISILGDVTVCKGDTATYSVSLSPGLTYAWSTSYQGNVSALGVGNATVTWVGTGSGTVYAYGIDGTGDTVEAGSLGVTISPLPVPYITSNAQVGCQQLAGDSIKKGEQGRQLPPVILDDANGCIRVCEFSVVTYYAHDQPGTTYTWDVDGEVSFADMGDSCIVNWGPNGPGSVTVTATNVNGCVASKTICIEIIHRPKAIFYTKPDSTYNTDMTSNFLSVCLADNIIFHDISTGTSGSPIMTSYWDFGDGTILPTSGPTVVNHSYSTPGFYEVILVVTNACNCKDTARLKIEVKPTPGVQISCPSVVCEGDTAGYKVHIPCGSYDWSVEGGTILSTMPYTDSIDIVWNGVDTSGFGYVIFDGAPCGGVCPGKTILKIPVIQQNGHISGPLIVCPNKQYIYRMPQWPTTDFNWTIVSGTGATIAHTDQRNEIVINTMNPGIITLQCNYTNTMLGCGGSATIVIKVQPAVSIIGPDKVCFKSTGNWTLSSGVGDWTLNLPGGGTYTVSGSSSFSYTFNTLGTYSLSVAGAFCAPDPIGFTVIPLPAPPDSLLGPSVACSGIPTLYTGKNPVPGTTFKWAAYTGSVNSATGSQTYATFTGAGPWVISVKRQETGGAHCLSDSLQMTVISPVPSFSISGPDTVCASTYQNYSVNYLDGDVYEWQIVQPERGSVTTLNDSPAVNILWNNVTGAGQSAKLIVKIRKCAAYYYDTLDVYIISAPVLTVTAIPDTICSGQLVNFTVTSSPGISSWTSITWDYGNGVTAPGFSASGQSYTYNITGATTNASFQATVTIVDANGCATTTGVSNPVWVKPAPVAHVSPDGPFVFCTTPFSVPLVATVTSGVGSTTNYTWNPGGPSGPSANSWTINNTYGSFSCTVTNSNGCSATSNVVNISQGCSTPCGPGNVPSLTVTPSITACGHVYVTASVSGSGWFSPGWSWPPTATGVTTSASDLNADFDEAGNYQFHYHVLYTNFAGDTCLKDTVVSIVVPYISGLKHTISCVSGIGYTVNLLDHSNFYPGVTLTHVYKLDGVTLTNNPGNMSATATGVAPGTHTLTQIISWGGYPACTTTYNITLDSLPNASFTVMGMMPACEDWVDVQFVNSSSPVTATSLWDFGDGSTNSQWNPSRTYDSAGTYNVTLTVSNIYGCSSSYTVPVQIAPDSLDGYLASLPVIPCQGDPVTLQYTSLTSVMPSLYTWYELSNVMYANVPNSSITVFDPGGYWVHGTDGFGCVVNTPVHVVDITQVPPAVITGDSSQCVNGQFTLNGWAGDDVIHYVWIIDGVAQPMGNNPTLDQTFATTGTHTYQLVVLVDKPGGGYCTDTSDVFTVVINPLPPTPWTNFNILDCNTYLVELTAGNSATGTYTWSNGASGTPAYAYTGGPYKVWFTDLNGCKSSTNMFVPKDPRTFMWVFPSGCYTFCKDNLPFTILGPNNLTNWVPWEWWQNGSVVSTGYGPVTPLTVTAPGTYNLMLDNGFCRDTSDDMDLAVISDCKDPCDQITIDIKGILNPDGTVTPTAGSKADVTAAVIAPPQPGPCDKTIVVSFNSTFGSSVPYNVSATNGTINPTFGVIPPGPSTTNFTFTPNVGFTSGWVYITFTAYLGSDDVKCTYVDSFYFECGIKGGPGSLVVTEMSNGPENFKYCEYAEMVVINCKSSTDKYVDVRGWILDDNSGNFNTTGCVSGVGIANGHYRLSYESIWSAVPVGSIIVIYNHDENCYKLPDNFTVQNNGSTNTYWIPIGGTTSAPWGTPHVERFSKLPMVGNCRYCKGIYEVANSWVATIEFYNKMDAFQVRCPGCTDLNPMEPAFYHGFGYGPQGIFATIPASGTNLGGPVHNVDGTNSRFDFIGSTRPDLGNPGMWKRFTADPAGTPPPSLGYISAGLQSMIVHNQMDLPCCDIKLPANRNGGTDGDHMDNLKNTEGIRVYPNPARDMLYVEFPMSQNVTIRISDVQGRVIATQSLEKASGAKFDVRSFAPGLYMYQIVTDGMVQSGKVLIAK